MLSETGRSNTRSLDWSADPHQTPSGGGQSTDPGQKRDTGDRISSNEGLTPRGPLQKSIFTLTEDNQRAEGSWRIELA
jgi:hypothetical protein